MPTAPTDIISALGSVLDIFLSDIRHRERAVFILCDSVVEMACKRKAKQTNHTFQTNCTFYAAWTASGVRLSRTGLGARVNDRRNTRNTMVHESTAVTVDTQTCADAIKDIIEVLKKLWGRRDSLNNLRDWHMVALRIVRLYSSDGDEIKRQEFEDAMRKEHWRGDHERRQPMVNENIFESGLRGFWGVLVKQVPGQVEQVLNACQIDNSPI